MTQNSVSHIFSRLFRTVIFLLIAIGTGILWYHYAPETGGSQISDSSWTGMFFRHFLHLNLTRGNALRLISCFVCGILFLFTVFRPKIGLISLCFCVPLLSNIPLDICNGQPYPIVLFATFAFLCGWYFRVNETPIVFSGRLWLNCFAIVLVISFAASFFRYCPFWQWGTADFISQPVNSLGMKRQDAVRYVVFVFCNAIAAVLLISSTCSIIKKNANPKRIQNHILAALLIGTTLAIFVAFYQYYGNINW